MILYLKRVLDFDEIECNLCLEEQKITNEEMLKILFEENKDIKIKGISNTSNDYVKKDLFDNLNAQVNDLIKRNDTNKNIIKSLEEKINIVIKEKNEIIKELNALKEGKKNLINIVALLKKE